MGELVVFNGTVMRGQPAHANLAGATFLEEVKTAPTYRLYSIGDLYPAMLHADSGGNAIAAELYQVPNHVWPRIRDSEPPGLYRGSLQLADGRLVDGMLGDADFVRKHATAEITSYGGWAAYLASLRTPEGR
jgi:AGZA family xanthine/uracil permease-like MFS transporter